MNNLLERWNNLNFLRLKTYVQAKQVGIRFSFKLDKKYWTVLNSISCVIRLVQVMYEFSVNA